MTGTDLEPVYEALALALDRVGPEQAQVYLAKVALALADELGNAHRALAVLSECESGLGDRR